MKLRTIKNENYLNGHMSSLIIFSQIASASVCFVFSVHILELNEKIFRRRYAAQIFRFAFFSGGRKKKQRIR